MADTKIEHGTLPEVQESGLTGAQVDERIARGATNVLSTRTSRSIGQIIRSNVFTLFNAIILAAMILVLATGSWKDAVFGLVIIINTGIGIFTELKAKRTLDRLSILVAAKSTVRRDGKDIDIDHDRIVIDDVLWIRAGEQVPADAAIIRSWGLELDESMLTGESATVKKDTDDTVYSGSNAVSGLALARVSAVGEYGYAAKLTNEAKVYTTTESDLNRGINTILKAMTFIVVPLCVILIFSQMRTVGGWNAAISTGAWRQAVVAAVAGVVGMIPEGLVLLTSLNFAIAAMRLARHNTLVQELEAVETLARVDSLNLDKTGTITDGGIEFTAIVPLTDTGNTSDCVRIDSRNGESAADDGTLNDGAAGGDASRLVDRVIVQALFDVSNEENPNGTGVAVLQGLGDYGIEAGHVDQRVPFSSARKWSAIARQGEGIWYLGAPEVVMAQAPDDDEILSQVTAYANTGNRVLLIARKTGDIPEDFSKNPTLARGIKPVALVLCSERIRDDAQDTLAWFRRQGVRCRIISGDNPVTVGAIASSVHLTGEREPRTMDARQLPQNIDELAETLESVDVLGRVLPEQKKAIVQALHSRGHVVAMTGDGVNDTLALKEADLGVAMGNAAPATKAVAQVVLVDSKFFHLPDVVARGRQVMANMERVASLFLVKTVYSVLISMGVVLTALPFPYLPRHITYIGALTIGMPAFILALAPNTRRYIPGFLRRVISFALPSGIAVGLSVLLSSWILPSVMGWDLGSGEGLTVLRATNAIIVFVLGIAVLVTVSRPLNSWRGLLVVGFAAAGVIGACIPMVANFFALRMPHGATLIATLIAIVAALSIFVLCQSTAGIIRRIARKCGGKRQRVEEQDA